MALNLLITFSLKKMHRTKPFYWWTSSFDWKLNLCHPKNNYEKAIIAIKGIIEMVVAQGSDLLKS